MRESITSLPERLLRWVPAALLAACASASLLWGWVGHAWIARMYEGDFQSFFVVPGPQKGRYSSEQLYALMSQALLAATLLSLVLNAGFVWVRLRGRLSAEGRYRLIAAFWIGVCTVAGAALLFFQGNDAEGYPMAKAMSFTADPPFLHRVLFVWVAKAVMWATGASVRASFFASQCVALLLAMTAIWKLAELYVERERAFLAPVLLTGILGHTFIYYTFYDMGIVFFYAAGLTLLFQRRRGWYLLVIGLATLNHENILFLILLSALLLWGEKGWLWMVAGQLAIHGAVRAALFQALPASAAWFSGNVWVNLEYLLVKPYDLTATMLLFLWFGAAIAAGWRSAPLELRQCLLLFPVLLAVTLLVGQINEARQFDAFVPVAVILLLRGAGAARRQ